MHATGVIDTNYAMGGQRVAYATARLFGPTGRSTEVTERQTSYAVTQTSMPIGIDDGTWRAELDAAEQCPHNSVYTEYPTRSATAHVRPHVQLQTVEWDAPKVQRTSGKATLRAKVVWSKNCTGRVEVCRSHSANPTGGFPTGTADFEWDLETKQDNETPGTITALANIMAYPSGCEVRPPDHPGLSALLAVE